MNEEGLKLLPESIHDWDEVKNSDDSEKFWDRIKNLRTKFGTGLFKPGDDAGAEAWGKFSEKAVELSGDRLMPKPDLEDAEQRNALYKTLGRPDDAAGYEFADVEGSELTDTHKTFMSEMAFKSNLTKSQLKAMDETIRTANLDSSNEAEKTFSDAVKELKQEWGLTYSDRLHQAKKVARSFFPHLGDDPILTAAEMKSFHSLFKQLGENNTEFTDQGEGRNNQGMSPSEASAKIIEIRENKEHPYFDAGKPGHTAARARMSELYRIKNNIALN